MEAVAPVFSDAERAARVAMAVGNWNLDDKIHKTPGNPKIKWYRPKGVICWCPEGVGDAVIQFREARVPGKGFRGDAGYVTRERIMDCQITCDARGQLWVEFKAFGGHYKTRLDI